ncbi:PIN domain-containing protein [Nocardia zapadnayensis]|nr:PIN domain-containing protein [Nocardia zapadnayensis]MCX0275912.1 PIN domain-containing protein [Nocardia zapadnayensis]
MQRVLFDTNILMSRLLRDTMVHLSMCNAFQPMWTEDIMAELVYRLRRDHPDWNEQQIGGLRRKLIGAFGTAAITGYSIAGHAEIRDPNDAHLDAAAEHGEVDYLVSDDKRALRPDPHRSCYELYSADDFLVLCDDSMPERVSKALLNNLGFHAKQAKETGKELPHFPERYEAAGAPKFAERVRKHLQSFNMTEVWKNPPSI